MGSQGDAGIDEVIADAVPDLPSPYGLAAPERAAPDGVIEVTFMILVHQLQYALGSSGLPGLASHGRF